MPKFQAPEHPKTTLTKEELIERISSVEEDIKELGRAINKNQSEMNVLYQKRFSIQAKISNKCIYKAQLLKQLKERHDNHRPTI